MRFVVAVFVVFIVISARHASAQSVLPGGARSVAAVGGDVGFLAPDNGDSSGPQPLQATTGSVNAFAEYYYSDRVSLRGMYGWARPEFESVPDRALQRQHLNMNVIYNWQVKRLRPFVTLGGGAYFIRIRDAADRDIARSTKPGGNIGWGAEYHLRGLAVKSEMNVHILADENRFPQLNGNTLTAFTWTFGLKVPF